MPTILNFEIRPREKGGYILQILQRGNSQILAEAFFDYDLSYMTEFEIKRLEPDAKDPHGRIERLKAFGTKLHEKLFTPDVLKLWHDYKDKSDFLGLCLRLAPAASKLEALPWETLFDGEEFLAAGAKTGLSRLPLDISIQNELPSLPPPLKMLAFMSSPLDLQDEDRLEVEREQEILLQAVNAPAGQGKLRVDFEDEAKLPILENSLESSYQIFHYSGHGISPENGGGLLLEDSQGKKRPTSVIEFLQAFQKGEKDLRLAVISGCQTARTVHAAGFRDLARGLARRKIPAVIAMQFSISDSAGLLLAENLYPRLIDGQMLEVAVSASRRALLHSDAAHIQSDAFAPVLFVSNSRPLQTTVEETTQITAQPAIDFSFHLPLAQLNFGFYGRRKEYRAIRDGLLYQNHRAIIVHGIGGIGKTALISHIASRLRRHFRGVYAFDCSAGTLAPETILLELHRYFERQGIHSLKQLLHQSIPPDQLASYLAHVLNQWSLLIIFDNFEAQLAHNKEGGHVIADENMRIFLMTLIKTTAQASRYLFTTRYLFDVDAKRIGTIQEVPLGDLSRPEALGLMQKLPHISTASFQDKLQAFHTFGGHPYALVTLDRHCGHRALAEVLVDVTNVHAELREFLAIELNYTKLSEHSRELLNRLAAFRKPVGDDAVHWVIGEKVELTPDFLNQIDRKELPEEMRSMSDQELLQFYQKNLPEQRRGDDVDRHISELIAWGLLTPLEDDSQMHALAVHSLVRDFCREKQGGEIWRKRLRDAAAFYINHSKFLRQDDKSTTTVWSEMQAFELLREAGEHEKAANLLMNITPLLDRWGFGRLLESRYRQLMQKVDRATVAGIRHNIGILLQARGDYAAALAEYEKSLKIKEELGNRAGVASSHGQIGKLLSQTNRYPEAFENFLLALVIFTELQSPYTNTVISDLKDLRVTWGSGNFDLVWKEKTGEDVPDRLKNGGD